LTEWSTAGAVALTGIMLVFAVLGLLNISVNVMGKMFAAKSRRDKEKARA